MPPTRVKWAVTAPSDDEVDLFDVYEGETPPGGVYRHRISQARIKINKNVEPMLNWLLTIAEPKGTAKAEYNGYSYWDNININDDNWPRIKRAMNGLGLTLEDFKGKTVTDGRIPSKEKESVPLLKIGTVKFDDTVMIRAKTRVGPDQTGEDRLNVQAYLPPKEDADDEPEPDDDDVPPDEDAVDDDADTDAEEDGDEAESDMSEEEEERWNELAGMERPALRKIAKELELTVKRAWSDDDLRNEIMDLEFSGEDDAEDDAEVDEPEAEPEAEPEPEPEPAARRRRPTKAAAGKTAARRGRAPF